MALRSGAPRSVTAATARPIGPGRPAGVDFDQLGACFHDVLDLVRVYHRVDETA